MKVRKGDIVEITFLDHAKGGTHIEFTTWGRVVSQNKTSIVIGNWLYSKDWSWTYLNNKDKHDPLDGNLTFHAILKSAITKVSKLRICEE
jgi:hypothetical protein